MPPMLLKSNVGEDAAAVGDALGDAPMRLKGSAAGLGAAPCEPVVLGP